MLRQLRTNLIYVIGGVANSFALFILIPYLVVRLPLGDYGNWNLYEVMTIFITMVALAGIDVGLMRSYWGEDADPPRPLIGTVIIGVTVWGIILTALGSLLVLWGHTWIAPLFALAPEAARNTLLLVLVTGVIEGWFTLLLMVFRVREQALIFVTLAFGRMILFLGLAVAWVEGGGGINGALMGRVIAAIVGVVVGLILLFPHFDIVWKRPIWNRIVRYGSPLLPTNIATYLLLASDRYILAAVATTQIVGIYGFMYKIATTMDIIIIRPFSLDWAQRRFTIANRPNAPHAYGQVLLFFLWLCCAFGVLVLSGTQLIYTLVDNPLYTPGMPYVPIVLLAFTIYGLSYPLNIGMILKDKTAWLPPLSWISAILCIALNLWWIPLYGMVGAAWSTVVGYAIFTFSLAVASQKIYPIRYPIADLIIVSVVTLIAGAGIYALEWLLPTAVWLNTVLKVLWGALLMLGVGYRYFGHYLVRKGRTPEPEDVKDEQASVGIYSPSSAHHD